MSTHAQFLAPSDFIFREIFHLSHDLMLIVGEEGKRLIDANPQLMKTFGYSPKEMRLLNPSRLFLDARRMKTFFSTVWNGHRNSLAEIACRHKSGRTIPAAISASMIVHGGKPCALAVIRDHTKYQPGYDAHQEQLARLLRAVPELGIAAGTVQEDIQCWLRQICHRAQLAAGHARIFARDLMNSVEAANLWHIAPAKGYELLRRNPGCIAFAEEFYAGVAATGTREIVTRLDRAPQFEKGEARNLDLKSAFAVPVVVGNTVAAVSAFFAARSIEEDPLLVEIVESLARELGHVIERRVLSMRLMRLQDDERRRLARELHDTTAQSMSMAILDLETVQQEAQSLSPKARAALSQSFLLARQSVREIRTFSYLLHPPMLAELGLLSALRIFIDGFSRRSGIRVRRELPSAAPKMSAEWEMALFYSVQEGLTNVQRHSASHTATVHLLFGPRAANLRIANDGASVPQRVAGGLPAAKVGVGIAAMRERVRAFGGDVLLYSWGNKTILDVNLPIRNMAALAASSVAGQ